MVYGIHMEHSMWIPWSKPPFYCSLYTIPYGIHGVHPFHMESIWKPSGSGKYSWWAIINVYDGRGYSQKHAECTASSPNYSPSRLPVLPGPLFPSTWSEHPAAVIDLWHAPWPPTEHLKLLHPLHTLGAIPCAPSERIPMDSWFSLSQATRCRQGLRLQSANHWRW